MSDETRVQEIRARHTLYDFGMVAPESGKWIASISCKGCHRPWPCEQSVLLDEVERLEARVTDLVHLHYQCATLEAMLTAERDAATAREQALREALEQARNAIRSLYDANGWLYSDLMKYREIIRDMNMTLTNALAAAGQAERE